MWLKVHRKDGNQFYNLDQISLIQREPMFDRDGKLGVKLVYAESECVVMVRPEDFASFEKPVAAKPG